MSKNNIISFYKVIWWNFTYDKYNMTNIIANKECFCIFIGCKLNFMWRNHVILLNYSLAILLWKI